MGHQKSRYLQMNPTDGNIHHNTPMSNNFNIHDSSLLMSNTMVPTDYNVSALKDNCEILRNGNNAGIALELFSILKTTLS